ncbi:GerAB/ArcD/ProY family transporter [Bacillus toyonensis]|uniref:GerAB/ArcD/ProY family transporter n=1 Tax=Bacillus toyonensis TaxID=155322 RepID=UPI001155DDDB|nr:GerAB/ArcD/ProY family transporter [Bacillus toyonensis]
MMQIKINYKIAPFFVFFVIHGQQFGAGVLGFSRIIAKEAGYDAWIGVILAGVIVHCLLWVMYYMLSLVQGSILTVHTYIFGTIIGNILNMVFMLYFFVVSVSVLRTYIEILQVWLYPTASTFILSLVFSFLIYYIISSGFRVITGLCIISIFVAFIYMILCLYCLLQYGHFDNFLPIWNHSLSDIYSAAKGSIYTMTGVEIILMIYPFIHSPQKSHKFAQYSVLFSNILYILSAVSALAIFSEEQLRYTIWSQLSMTQLIELPFLQRIDYLVISGYIFIMITSITLPLWAITRGMKEIFHVKQKYILIGALILSIISSILLNNRHVINTFTQQVANFSQYLILIYIPLLCLILHIKVKVTQNKQS